MPRNLLFGVFGSEISFADKRKNGWSHLQRRSHIFSSLILTLVTRIYKVADLWKSVDFKPQF